jgi:hypothetical protein
MIAPLPVGAKNLLTRLRSFCDQECGHERPEGAGCVGDAGRDSWRSHREPSERFAFCRIAIRLAALSTILLLPHDPSAGAGSAGATLGVSATVARNCSLSTGVSNPVGPASSATKPVGNAQLTVTCSKGAGQTIAIDTDGNASAIKDIRPLSNGVSTLNFDVKKEVFVLIVNF